MSVQTCQCCSVFLYFLSYFLSHLRSMWCSDTYRLPELLSFLIIYQLCPLCYSEYLLRFLLKVPALNFQNYRLTRSWFLFEYNINQQLYFPKISYLLYVCFSRCEFTHRLSFLHFFPCQFFGHCWFYFCLWVWEFLFTILKELLFHTPGILEDGAGMLQIAAVMCPLYVRPSPLAKVIALCCFPSPKPLLHLPRPPNAFFLSNTHICKLLSKKSGWNQMSTSQVYII